MSVERVREYLAPMGFADRIREFDVSSATVELAAQAVGVEAARIAKTLSFHDDQSGAILIVCAGDAKVDNAPFRAEFGVKAKMLHFEEIEELTGYRAGGVSPFAVKDSAKVYLDESLRRFETVFPAAGSSQSAVEMTPEELEKASCAVRWVNVCKGWQPSEC